MSVYEFVSRTERINVFCDTREGLMKTRSTASTPPSDSQSQLITEYTKQIDGIKRALRNTAQSPVQAASSNFAFDYKYVQVANAMISVMKYVKKLQPGVQVEGFINTLKNNYDLLVKRDVMKFPRLETKIKIQRLRLPESSNTQLTNSNEDVSTFQKFTE